jgi:hypothetical protein
MITLLEHITNSLGNGESNNVFEGGNAGHMKHPIDYNDYTCQDLLDLVSDLFDSKVKGISEKLDGTNIQATMNDSGDIVFIRNKTDLNSYKGGMTIEDMARKWESLPNVQNTFVKAGEIITRVFKNIGKDWFNPDKGTKRIVNCECITSGITNIMPYAKDQVSFHDIWIFKKGMIGWEHKLTTKDGIDVLDKACVDIEEAHITPNVIVRITDKSEKLKDFYKGEILKIFDNKRKMTVGDWKKKTFIDLCKAKYDWITDYDVLFNRWFLDDKSTNLRVLKKSYPGHEQDIDDLCKDGYKKIVSNVIKPLDRLFIKLGNDVIALCDGLTNGGSDAAVAVATLQKNLQDAVDDIKMNGTDDSKLKLANQLERLSGGDNSINPTEGIVFVYKGKLQKLTGSFGALNQILGNVKFNR